MSTSPSWINYQYSLSNVPTDMRQYSEACDLSVASRIQVFGNTAQRVLLLLLGQTKYMGRGVRRQASFSSSFGCYQHVDEYLVRGRSCVYFHSFGSIVASMPGLRLCMIATSIDTFSAKCTNGIHVFRPMIRGVHLCPPIYCSTIYLPQHFANLSSDCTH